MMYTLYTSAPKWDKESDTVFNSQNAFVDIRGSYHSKNIVKAWRWLHFHFGQAPPETGAPHRLWPPAGTRQGRFRAAYSAHSLWYWCTAGWTKWKQYRTCRADGSTPQTWRGIQFTWNFSPCRIAWSMFRQTASYSLHILGPSGPPQCPRVDKPHHESVAGTRLAVAGCVWKDVAQVVQNGPGVTDGNHRKFSQDILNGEDIKNRFPEGKLVYNSRAHRFQPSWIKNNDNNYTPGHTPTHETCLCSLSS